MGVNGFDSHKILKGKWLDESSILSTSTRHMNYEKFFAKFKQNYWYKIRVFNGVDCPTKPFVDMTREEVEIRSKIKPCYDDTLELFRWRLSLTDEEWDAIKLLYRLSRDY